MKLSEYIQKLQEIVKNNPEDANLEVIYARDDEGNGYQKVSFAPSLVFVYDIENYNIELCDKDEPGAKKMPTGAICIN
jgi:hypothetical protein